MWPLSNSCSLSMCLLIAYQCAYLYVEEHDWKRGDAEEVCVNFCPAWRFNVFVVGHSASTWPLSGLSSAKFLPWWNMEESLLVTACTSKGSSVLLETEVIASANLMDLDIRSELWRWSGPLAFFFQYWLNWVARSRDEIFNTVMCVVSQKKNHGLMFLSWKSSLEHILNDCGYHADTLLISVWWYN